MNLTKQKRFTSLVIIATMVGVLAATLSSCNESSTTVEDYVGVQTSDPYDPSKPVTVSSFNPTSGSVGQQIVIMGSNFGNDSTIVNVTIGGKKAVLGSL